MSSPQSATSESDELERAFDEDFAAWDSAEQEADEDRESLQAEALDASCGVAQSNDVKVSRSGDVSVNAAAPRQRSPVSLLSLPREMLLRILSLVPATGLTSCACACSTMSALASDDTLWRRLYCARWGKPSQGTQGDKQWKRSYLDADSEEWEATTRTGAGGGDDAALGAIFLDMLRAKRDTAPDRRMLDSPLQADPGDIAAKVAAWRRSRGFDHIGSGPGGSSQPPQPPPRPDLSRRGRAAVTFTRINPGEQPPVYACDQTGWVHVCGDACTEGVIDSKSELLVCPVSGQTTDRLVHECEEDEAEGARGCGAAAGGGEEEAGMSVFGGGFAAFFVAGYECENEKALNKLLGYKAL